MSLPSAKRANWAQIGSSGLLKSSAVAAAGLLLAGLLSGCAAESENFSPQAPVGESLQYAGAANGQPGSASLEAYPPSGSAGDVAIGVDTDQYEDTDPSALSDFRPVLEPYGSWEDDATYGTVWLPSEAAVGPDFQPYVSGGHWTYDDSWVWASDYSWGWAPFHYGRWVMMPGRGWGWIPGRRYSGAWVSWSMGPSYVGWAPLGPSWGWYNGYAVGVGYGYTPYYAYCPHQSIFAPTVSTVVVRGPSASGIASSTRPYVPASPSVGGGASAGGRVAARPNVGPVPTELGHSMASVPHPSSVPSIDKARGFAYPKQAVAAGGHAPASGSGFTGGNVPRYAAPAGNFGSGASASAFAGARDRQPDATPGSSFGNNFGQQHYASANTGTRAAFASPAANANVRASSSNSDPWRVPTADRSQTTPSGASPSPRPSYSPSGASTPVLRSVYQGSGSQGSSAPVYSRPQYSAPVYSRPSNSYAQPSAPVYGRSAPVSQPAPSYRSVPNQSYRGPSQSFSQPSAPVYSHPSYSQPSYHAPAAAAPVARPSFQSAPVSRPSAPAARGGGGSHGGHR